MKPLRNASCLVLAGIVCLAGAGQVVAADLPTLAGPAMGTTYRVTLAGDIAGLPRGEVHREIEVVLARIDRAASTWREDSDASRFNRAAADEWVPVSTDLVEIVEIARVVHERSDGAFDVTVGKLARLPPGADSAAERATILAGVGMRHVESRRSSPALRKLVAGVEIDLSGIGPGYAVDRIGDRLLHLGSDAHLVELGGEVRAWGTRPDGRLWRVLDRGAGAGRHAVVELKPGEAIATATSRPGRSPIDPRTGLVVKGGPRSAAIRAATCAEADAQAVATLVIGGPTAAH